jgi:ankyrin repeat protein
MVVMLWWQDGRTALLRACDAGRIDVVRWLVTEGGSDPQDEEDQVRHPPHRMCASVTLS